MVRPWEELLPPLLPDQLLAPALAAISPIVRDMDIYYMTSPRSLVGHVAPELADDLTWTGPLQIVSICCQQS